MLKNTGHATKLGNKMKKIERKYRRVSQKLGNVPFLPTPGWGSDYALDALSTVTCLYSMYIRTSCSRPEVRWLDVVLWGRISSVAYVYILCTTEIQVRLYWTKEIPISLILFLYFFIFYIQDASRDVNTYLQDVFADRTASYIVIFVNWRNQPVLRTSILRESQIAGVNCH